MTKLVCYLAVLAMFKLPGYPVDPIKYTPIKNIEVNYSKKRKKNKRYKK